uniref:Uncharacterized protein n=1 Tax=Salvator merianae TaxID=96440 RepID=A0A8D0C5K2_SALMN
PTNTVTKGEKFLCRLQKNTFKSCTKEKILVDAACKINYIHSTSLFLQQLYSVSISASTSRPLSPVRIVLVANSNKENYYSSQLTGLTWRPKGVVNLVDIEASLPYNPHNRLPYEGHQLRVGVGIAFLQIKGRSAHYLHGIFLTVITQSLAANPFRSRKFLQRLPSDGAGAPRGFISSRLLPPGGHPQGGNSVNWRDGWCCQLPISFIRNMSESKFREVLPKQGKLAVEDVTTMVLCKPKLLPLKSVTLEKLEKMQREAQETIRQQELLSQQNSKS